MKTGSQNICIHNDDARDVMAALPDKCLDQAYLLYPDPWPKKRHNKRRFINTDNLDQLFRILKPGAGFLVASDIADYLDWTLIHIRAHGGFDWQAKTAADWLDALMVGLARVMKPRRFARAVFPAICVLPAVNAARAL